MNILAIFFFILSGLVHSSELWSDRVGRLDLPEAHAITRQFGTQNGTIPLDSLERPLCGHTLVPTHPEQDKKHYHYRRALAYNGHRLQSQSPLCAVHQPNNRCRRYQGHQFDRCMDSIRCLSARNFIQVVVSDIYHDHCGNRYRGYALNQYITPEKMFDLVSRGRTLKRKDGSHFEEYEAGHIWSVPASEFLVIELLEEAVRD